MSPTPILYVHHRPELGGAPRSLAYLISELDRDRFTPSVFCPPGPAADLFRSVGAHVYEGPVSQFTHIWASRYTSRKSLLLGRELALLPGHVHALRSVIRRERFGLVHLNDSPLVAAGRVARAHGLPVVWHLRSALSRKGQIRRRFVRSSIRRTAAASIAINGDVAASFDVGASVVPNSIDLNTFRPGDAVEARAKLGLPSDRFVAAFIGFLYPSKGYADAVEAVGTLSRRGIDVTLLLVGGEVRDDAFFSTRKGKLFKALGVAQNHRAPLEQRIRELGIESSVRFVPFTHEPEVVYQASDAIIAPSRGPELGRPILEAAASGRPVIATGSATGAGIVLPRETGLLVPPASHTALADALEELHADTQLRQRLGSRARMLAESEFDAARNTRRVMEIYERVLHANRD